MSRVLFCSGCCCCCGRSGLHCYTVSDRVTVSFLQLFLHAHQNWNWKETLSSSWLYNLPVSSLALTASFIHSGQRYKLALSPPENWLRWAKLSRGCQGLSSHAIGDSCDSYIKYILVRDCSRLCEQHSTGGWRRVTLVSHNPDISAVAVNFRVLSWNRTIASLPLGGERR